jgi:hypothetical protein
MSSWATGHSGNKFVTQALQLLQAGRMPFLQSAQTLAALQKLVDYAVLPAADAEVLTAAYVFLRDVEHRLQMENNLQTHTIPTERKARERLARLMGFETLDDFERARHQHSRSVRDIYHRMLKSEPVAQSSLLPTSFEGAEEDWKILLARHGFRDAEKALHTVKEFIKGPGYVHVSARTEELARELFSRFLQRCPRGPQNPATSESKDGKDHGGETLSDPDRVLVRLDSFMHAYGGRAAALRALDKQPFVIQIADVAVRPVWNFWRRWRSARRTWWTSLN